eukprot:gene2411-1514_t
MKTYPLLQTKQRALPANPYTTFRNTVYVRNHTGAKFKAQYQKPTQPSITNQTHKILQQRITYQPTAKAQVSVPQTSQHKSNITKSKVNKSSLTTMQSNIKYYKTQNQTEEPRHKDTTNTTT